MTAGGMAALMMLGWWSVRRTVPIGGGAPGSGGTSSVTSIERSSARAPSRRVTVLTAPLPADGLLLDNVERGHVAILHARVKHVRAHGDEREADHEEEEGAERVFRVVGHLVAQTCALP